MYTQSWKKIQLTVFVQRFVSVAKINTRSDELIPGHTFIILTADYGLLETKQKVIKQLLDLERSIFTGKSEISVLTTISLGPFLTHG